MSESNLTAARLRELVSYNRRTGIMVRRKNAHRSDLVGLPMGRPSSAPGGRIYLRARLDGKDFMIHRLAWLYVHGCWPHGDIDHRDHNGLNNRFSNLRDVSRSVNNQNRRAISAAKKTGTLLGASYVKKTDRWGAYITLNRKRTCLGSFLTEEAAHAAYLEAKRKMHEGCTI